MISAVSEQQDQAATAEVALLGTRPPDDGLDVVDARFGFDHRIDLALEDEPIGAAEIAGRGPGWTIGPSARLTWAPLTGCPV